MGTTRGHRICPLDQMHVAYKNVSGFLRENNLVPVKLLNKGMYRMNCAREYYYLQDFKCIVDFHKELAEKVSAAWLLLLNVLGSTANALLEYGTPEELQYALKCAIEYNVLLAFNQKVKGGLTVFGSPSFLKGLERVRAIRMKICDKKRSLKYM